MPAIQLRSRMHPADFLATMQPILEQEEARHGLMLGVVMRLAREDGSDKRIYLAIVEDGERPVVAAIMTPPHGILVYCREPLQADHEGIDYEPLQLIARDLYRQKWSIPSVNGLQTASFAFAQAWQQSTGQELVLSERLRVFELRAVEHPTYSAGRCRLATLHDLETVGRWIYEFSTSAVHAVQVIELDDALEIAQSRIESEAVYLWDDAGPVSLAGIQRPTRRGITIGPVYTPQDRRGRGYATSCVAAVSQRMLDQGIEFCTLFTDLANPVSNHIYEKIGYRPVGDYALYRQQ